MTAKKTDIYQEVTDEIVSILEENQNLDFNMPFLMDFKFKIGTNPTTSKPYRGVNPFILFFSQMKNEFISSQWATFKQWKELGATVKKGSKGTRIIFYKFIEREEENKQTGEIEENGFAMVKYYTVFNADQVEGYEDLTIQAQNDQKDLVETIKDIDFYVSRTGAKIIPCAQFACYNVKEDQIEMPAKERFIQTAQTPTENYYATLLHELTHWTGAQKRLKRLAEDKPTKEQYAYEELVAELGSAFLCSKFDIRTHNREDHAAYIQSWLKALKNDKKLIFRASSDAQKAVDFLDGIANVDEENIRALKVA